MTSAWFTCSRLRTRHFEVVGERENGRARGRQATRAVSFTIDKSIRKNQKQRNIQRFFNATASVNLSGYNYWTYFYLISVFLHTVLYFIKKWFIVTNFTLPRLFRNSAISNFLPFPLGLRNSGVQLYNNRLHKQIVWPPCGLSGFIYGSPKFAYFRCTTLTLKYELFVRFTRVTLYFLRI